MTIKKGDFIELDYTGKIVANGHIFDTTLANVAKEAGAFDPKQKYGSIVICIGEAHLLAGLDAFLTGKDVGMDYEIELAPDQAFGKRNAKLIQLTSLAKFKGQEHPPFPGAQFVIDGVPAVVKSVSGGRVILDFNHPLAGKKLHYWLKVNKKVTDAKTQANCVLERLGLPTGKYSLDLKDKTLKIKIDDELAKLMKSGLKEIEKKVKTLVSGVNKVELASDSKSKIDKSS